ncbi:helix-turn-helix transcriptional regulator [Limnoraphis robusta]|uniref:Transcriptional regulator n=1 Tax=Limnoraphis robusta CS-951 TaxID=1637645 RepID=A0A0F5YF89_9CYAN|nr:WYL domain-containing transcriptional regulator [Limnoraphis robusta]KKD37307.1 transcriptional regulator [Limnoraphis robusta CS-951]
MSPKRDNYNQLAFALEILRLLSQKPLTRNELCDLLSTFLERHDKTSGDINQKVVRTISKLRDCGFDIQCSPHHPYKLIESNFPILLSLEQRQALAMAANFLGEMGFSTQAAQILRIANINYNDQPSPVNVNFSPPVDYSETQTETVVRELQERLNKKCCFSIRYRSSNGNEKIWDIHRSELRLHNGVLYLFTFIPTWFCKHEKPPSFEQNVALRVDRILKVFPSSHTPWTLFNFPTQKIHYRMSGELRNYQPRRANEQVFYRDSQGKFVDILAEEDYPFWFRQRILQYGSNVLVLEPEWLAKEIQEEHQKAFQQYSLKD